MPPYWFVLSGEEVNKTFQWVPAVSHWQHNHSWHHRLHWGQPSSSSIASNFSSDRKLFGREALQLKQTKAESHDEALDTQWEKPRVMSANQYLLFVTIDSYERSDSALPFWADAKQHIIFCSPFSDSFFYRQQYPITAGLWRCGHGIVLWWKAMVRTWAYWIRIQQMFLLRSIKQTQNSNKICFSSIQTFLRTNSMVLKR